MKKSCENCSDYIVCWQEGTLQKEACNRWMMDIVTFQKELEKFKTKDPNEIKRITDKIVK